MGSRSALSDGTARCSTVRSMAYSTHARASTASPIHSRVPAFGCSAFSVSFCTTIRPPPSVRVSRGWDTAMRRNSSLRLTPSSSGAIVNRMVKSDTLDRTFSALADPKRRDILTRLSRGPASISELAEPFDISLPGVLKHVRILEEANLVTSEKNGRTRECRLGPEHMDDVTRWIEVQRQRWERRLDRLDAAIERKKGEAT